MGDKHQIFQCDGSWIAGYKSCGHASLLPRIAESSRSTAMKRVFLCAALLCLGAVCGIAPAAQRARTASRTFQFRYHAVVKDVPAGAQKVEVWIPYPTSDAHQTIDEVSIDAPGHVMISREPEYGNSVLYVRVDH